MRLTRAKLADCSCEHLLTDNFVDFLKRSSLSADEFRLLNADLKGNDALIKALNDEPQLLDVWKKDFSADFITSRKDSDFLKAFKKVEDDNVWKHIEGEVHSPTFSNGGHYLGATTLVTDINGIQWVTGAKIRFKASDVRIPNPYTYGMEIQKARRIEIFDGINWVSKTSGGTSSFFPNTWDKQRIIEETALAFKKAKASPNTYWDAVSNGNTYYIMGSDGHTKITLFYGSNGDINPLLNGTTNPIIKSSFPKF